MSTTTTTHEMHLYNNLFRIFSHPTINEYKVCDIDIITPRGLSSTDRAREKNHSLFSVYFQNEIRKKIELSV